MCSSDFLLKACQSNHETLAEAVLHGLGDQVLYATAEALELCGQRQAMTAEKPRERVKMKVKRRMSALPCKQLLKQPRWATYSLQGCFYFQSVCHKAACHDYGITSSAQTTGTPFAETIANSYEVKEYSARSASVFESLKSTFEPGYPANFLFVAHMYEGRRRTI